MPRKRHLIFALILLPWLAIAVSAHHSVTAEFDPSKTMTLKGTVSKVDWVNPHIYIYVDVTGADGKVTTWMLQSLPPLFYRKSGLTKEMLLSNKQEATITAYPAKDGTRAYGFLVELRYADGHYYSLSPNGDKDTPGSGR